MVRRSHRRQDRRGRAQFAAASTDGKGALTYRVKALPFRGLRKVTSAPVSTARWQRASWTDEFSGDRLDPVWNHRGREYVKTARRSCSKGDPRAVTVGGGAARLSIIKDPDATKKCRIRGRDAVKGKYAYRLNGHIGTQGAYSFRYGHAAARVKFHRLRGQHGAFWLQPADGMHPASTGAEIDVVEYFGDHHPQAGWPPSCTATMPAAASPLAAGSPTRAPTSRASATAGRRTTTSSRSSGRRGRSSSASTARRPAGCAWASPTCASSPS